MILFVIIGILALTLITFPLRLGIKGHIDIFDNDGFFSLSFFGVPVYRGKVHYESEDLTHNNIVIESGKKVSNVHLNADKNDKQSIISIISNPLFRCVNINEIFVDARIGKSDDAFFTMALVAGMKIFYLSAMAFLKSRNTIYTGQNFVPEYTKNVFEIDYKSIFSISIADIIYGSLSSIRRKS